MKTAEIRKIYPVEHNKTLKCSRISIEYVSWENEKSLPLLHRYNCHFMWNVWSKDKKPTKALEKELAFLALKEVCYDLFNKGYTKKGTLENEK